MFKPLKFCNPFFIFAVIGLIGLQGCAVSKQPLPQIENKIPASDSAGSDVQEPVDHPKLALIADLVGRLETGQAVADLLMPSITFSFEVYEPCAAIISRTVNSVDAQAIDDGFGFDADYDGQNPDCTPPDVIPVWIDFTLSDRVAMWSNIKATADDHNFEVFYFAPEGGTESLMVYLSPTEESYKISKIAYNRAHDVNGESELE